MWPAVRSGQAQADPGGDVESLLRAACRIADGKAAALSGVEPDGGCRRLATYGAPVTPDLEPVLAELVPALFHRPRVVDGVRRGRSDVGARFGWALVPLLDQDCPVAVLFLMRRESAPRLGEQEQGRLLALGREAAALVLARARPSQRVDDGSPVPRAAAATHDLKSLAGLLAMTVANARRHRADPVFIDDLLATLDGAAAKLDRILAVLRGEDRAPRRIELGARLERLVRERGESKVRLRVEDPRGGWLEVDPEGFDVALGHLVDNALEAAVGAEIILGREGRAATIEVRDHGPGMTPAFVRDALFVPFVSTKPGGQGLGAHQARRFAEACGGRLEVDSSPGGGTTMRLVLPLDDPGAAGGTA